MDMGVVPDGFAWGHMGASFSQYWKKNKAGENNSNATVIPG